MRKKEKAKIVVERLDEFYPGLDKCYLNYTQPYELLFATILSAQCTDDRVNMVTEKLFQKYKTLEDYTKASLTELEEDVKSTGFYRNKAKSLKESAGLLLQNHNGVLPSTVEELTALSGVGRKTANVVRSHIFNLESIVVDTHVKRISNKLGLTKEKDPVKIEFDLMKVIPKDAWIRYNQQVIAHGRKVCKARKPLCDECCFHDICVVKG